MSLGGTKLSKTAKDLCLSASNGLHSTGYKCYDVTMPIDHTKSTVPIHCSCQRPSLLHCTECISMCRCPVLSCPVLSCPVLSCMWHNGKNSLTITMTDGSFHLFMHLPDVLYTTRILYYALCSCILMGTYSVGRSSSTNMYCLCVCIYSVSMMPLCVALSTPKFLDAAGWGHML